MTEDNPETLILGMQCSDAVFGIRPLLYWDKEKGNKGYHSIRWEKTEDGFRIKERTYVWGTAHEEQAGVVLPEIYERTPDNWFWAKEPVGLFPGAHGFYMKRDLADKLNELSDEDAFSGLGVNDELHSRDVVIGFSTVDAIQSRRSQWYNALEVATDKLLRTYLANGSDEEVAQMADWLRYLVTTEHQDEQANLRFILTHPMSDEQLAKWCDFQGPTYEMYDREAGTNLVKRSDDGRRVIVPEDKMFASPENATKALEVLRESLTQ